MTVLIIDDESIVRRSLERAFLGRGHEVESASGGIEGIARWQKFEPDCVFIDVLMPDMNGPKVLEKIGPTTAKVILMSAYSGDYNLEKAQSVGADIFISKPFEDIFKTVEMAEELVGV